MSIIEQFLKLFVTKDSEKYSDEQIQKLLQKAVSPTVKKYNSGLKQHKSLFNKNENLNRLIVLRCYAYELFYDVCKGDLQRDIYGRRINVIETALLRCEIATDENIVLLNYGYGLGVTSNLRLMIESFAIAKYLWDMGENEAQRFQDYMEFQKSEIEGCLLKMEGKYEKDFF